MRKVTDVNPNTNVFRTGEVYQVITEDNQIFKAPVTVLQFGLIRFEHEGKVYFRGDIIRLTKIETVH